MAIIFAQVIVNVPSIAGVFDYSIPTHLAGRVSVGHLVTVPFGKQTVQGVVSRISDQSSVPQTKDIIDLVDVDPVLTQNQIALMQWMTQNDLTPLADLVNLFLPPGLARHADVLYELDNNRYKEIAQAGISPSPVAAKIIRLLQNRGALRGRQIDRHFNQVNWRNSARSLVRSGYLAAVPTLPPARVRPRSVRTVQLSVTPETAMAVMTKLGQKSTLEKRQKAIQYLIQQPQPVEVAWVYAVSGCKLADLQALEELELISLGETEVLRDPLENITDDGLTGSEVLQLSPDQQKAWERIEVGLRSLAKGEAQVPFLLDGVTGSGKTELYIRSARAVILAGKQVVILVPEISLTPQNVRRFNRHFPGQVGLIHSKLSEGEHYDTWRRARSGSLKLILGARSALFTPFSNLGLIVVDECHDASYYQSEPPFYHAVKTGKIYAEITGALCLLGSATPTIQQRYQTEIGQSNRLTLPKRIFTSTTTDQSSGLPPVKIVDMRDELKAGNRSIFSRDLIHLLEETLAHNEQAILFLNRRGSASYVFCRTCGFVVKCPRCDTPMTLHVTAGDKMNCHHCGHTRDFPRECPVCASSSIGAYGLGSEKVEREVQKRFPKARILRWDWDTTRQKHAHEIILKHFAAHRADLLVGTQMLAKGLDLPLVTLVGIVFADVGLNLPDPYAIERVYQVLTHVSGRAGRSQRGGRVILQTFQPNHYAIEAVGQHDADGFYVHELAERKRLNYPPFARLVRLEYRHFEAGKAEKEANQFAAKIRGNLMDSRWSQTSLIGPVPCFFARMNGKFRWQLILRGPDPVPLIRKGVPKDWRVEVDPISLL